MMKSVAVKRVECVVIGNKPFHGVEFDEEGNSRRIVVYAGATVYVTQAQMKVFAHRLITPAVAAAQKAAARAMRKAEKEIEEGSEDDTPPVPEAEDDTASTPEAKPPKPPTPPVARPVTGETPVARPASTNTGSNAGK